MLLFWEAVMSVGISAMAEWGPRSRVCRSQAGVHCVQNPSRICPGFGYVINLQHAD